jgi:hypothetical protein
MHNTKCIVAAEAKLRSTVVFVIAGAREQEFLRAKIQKKSNSGPSKRTGIAFIYRFFDFSTSS